MLILLNHEKISEEDWCKALIRFHKTNWLYRENTWKLSGCPLLVTDESWTPLKDLLASLHYTTLKILTSLFCTYNQGQNFHFHTPSPTHNLHCKDLSLASLLGQKQEWIWSCCKHPRSYCLRKPSGSQLKGNQFKDVTKVMIDLYWCSYLDKMPVYYVSKKLNHCSAGLMTVREKV